MFLYCFRRAKWTTTQSKIVRSSRFQFFFGFWILIILNQRYFVPLNSLLGQICNVLWVKSIIVSLVLGFLEFGKVPKKLLIIFEVKRVGLVDKFLQPVGSLVKALYFLLVKIMSRTVLLYFIWFALWTFAFSLYILNFRHEEVQYFDFINIKKNFIFYKNWRYCKITQMNLKIEKTILMCRRVKI